MGEEKIIEKPSIWIRLTFENGYTVEFKTAYKDLKDFKASLENHKGDFCGITEDTVVQKNKIMVIQEITEPDEQSHYGELKPPNRL